MSHLSRIVRFFGVCTILVLLLHVTATVKAQSAKPQQNEPFRVTFEVNAYWNGPKKDALRQVSSMHPFVLTWLLRDSESISGIKADNILQLEMNGDPPNGGTFTLKTLRPIDTEKVLTALVPDAKELQHGSRSYFANEEGAVCFLDAQTVITAPAKLMPACIDRYEATKDAPNEAQSTEESKKPLLELQIDPTAFREGLPPQGPPEWLRTLVNAELLKATFLPTEKLAVQFDLQFASANEAIVSLPAVKEAIAQLGKYLEMAEENMPMAIERFALEYPEAKKLGPMLDSAIKSARSGLANAEIEQNENAVEVKVSIESKQPAADAVLLISLMPRGAKE